MQNFDDERGHNSPDSDADDPKARAARMRNLRSTLAERSGPVRTHEDLEAMISDAGPVETPLVEPLNIDALGSPASNMEKHVQEDLPQPVQDESRTEFGAETILDAQARLKAVQAPPEPHVDSPTETDPVQKLDAILADNMPTEDAGELTGPEPANAINPPDSLDAGIQPEKGDERYSPAPEHPKNPAGQMVAGPVSVPTFDDDPQSASLRRKGRAKKTRLLGFDQADEANDLFARPTPNRQAGSDVKFPVGWMVVVGGPGIGGNFPLTKGVAQIGRGEDQAVRLDFGDTSISRENHAAIAYDHTENEFTLAQGGKANLVRLNGRPVLSNESLNDRDELRIGKTTLRFIAMCDADFQWPDTDEGDEE